MRTLTFLLATGLVYAQSGDWLLITTEFGAPQYQRIDLKFEGEKITGRAGTLTYEGTLRDGRVAFESKRADGSTITKYSGTFTPGEMQGQGTAISLIEFSGVKNQRFLHSQHCSSSLRMNSPKLSCTVAPGIQLAKK